MSFIEKVLIFALCFLASVHFALGFSYGPVVVPDKPSFMDALFVTDTSIITRTHTLRKTATSNVYVTSAVLVPVTVTQYSTRRDFVEEDPDTITSFIRLTSTPIVIETNTIEKMPVRTVVSKVTQLRTVTSTVDLWQPITHYDTSFEVVRLPVQETQTLLQVVYDTITVTSRNFITSTHGLYRYGY
ncbi:hypothetical protein Avbf_14306 [Armadillidium vulgare]|nr:hypothetical protein Avbf_14306 [Armadillidium vulgare]